ncbi:glycosyltransferase family 2 protein [Pedobacter chitinilyticus]|uniref:Glycosyltransferase family 2 protein n=1 Tax=Pedobacter chitinilyticus TaxID=2233776 RepID=A0A443YX92_9SPHI|nr:glycosyltransferase family 2 protein [Pedobacter chitinilyticus]RWU08605.1 glycosyltransferase family 2 protein [Pedobacter chitinilyticus]
MINHLVSIIIPLYNAEKYISETIRSILNQTYKNWELIIINDGSSDNSLNEVEKFFDHRIKIFSISNSGASVARNIGLAKANGGLVQFLDADDVLSNDKIEIQVEAIKNNANFIAVCSTAHFSEDACFKHSKPNPYEDAFLTYSTVPSDFLINLWGGNDGKGSMIQPNAWLIHKNLIDKVGGWNEKLTLDDDGEFFARIILGSEKIIKTDGTNFYRKYSNKNNLSGLRSEASLYSLLNSVLLKKKHLLERDNSQPAKFAIQRMLFDVALLSYPKFNHITKIAFKNSVTQNPKDIQLGGRVINFIANHISWKIARHLQIIFR